MTAQEISKREAMKVAHAIAGNALTDLSKMLDDKRPEDRSRIEAALLALAHRHYDMSRP